MKTKKYIRWLSAYIDCLTGKKENELIGLAQKFVQVFYNSYRKIEKLKWTSRPTQHKLMKKQDNYKLG